MTLQSIRVPFTSVYQLKEERKTEEENNIFFNTDPLARKVRLSKRVLISRSICVLEMIVERTWREKVDVCFDVFEKMRTCIIGIKDKRSRTYVISIGDKLI